MNRIIQKVKNTRIFDMIPWLWMFAGFLYDMWYQIYPGKWILDSDLAAEMVLAAKLNEEGGILSKDWLYSTELRAFQSQWFYRIGLLIFPDNWHCARIVASALMLILLAALVLMFTYLIGMGKYGVWCTAILMWPFGRWYLVYALYGTYYIIYMMFSLVIFSTLLLLNKVKGPKKYLLYPLGMFFSFAAGVNGIKQTLVFFGPLLFAAFLLVFFAIRDRKPVTYKEMFSTCRNEIRILIHSVFFTICNLAGYLLNSLVLSQIYSFESFGESKWAWELPNRLGDVWMDFFLLFGYYKLKAVDSVASFKNFKGCSRSIKNIIFGR